MSLAEEISTSVFGISGPDAFESAALEVFRFQFSRNRVYRQFAAFLGKIPGRVHQISDIPFLPARLFRDQVIFCGDPGEEEKIFTSSGTTGSIPSRHFIRDLSLYRQSFHGCFRQFYGDPGKYRFLALLPGYLERQDSSLVYMMDEFIRMTAHHGSGFYLHDHRALASQLDEPATSDVTTILFGASYALLDFSEISPVLPPGTIVMETGGMKGRKREMIREELHEKLCKRFGVKEIHSEYGMTELLSQAYSQGNGRFQAPPWMRVLIRDPNDPLQFVAPGKTGGISIIDLANIHSCSFIATQDLGKVNDDGSFEVLGRFDDSDLRGCNLLVV